jgi:hypothetical protein
MRLRTLGLSLPRALGLCALVGLLSCSDSTDPSNQPTILLLNPRGVPAGIGQFQLSIYGENLGTGSTVHWNGEERLSGSYGDNAIYANIPAADVAAEGTARITVVRPDGRVTNTLTLAIGDEFLEPEMTLTSIAPAKGTAGAGDIEITGTGTGFIPGTALLVNFSFLETTRVSNTTLRAVVPAALLAVNQPLDVRLGVPGVWTATTGLIWNVEAAVPVIASLDPAGTGTGSEDQQVRVLGSGFTASSVVRVNGAERTTTFVSATELGITLTAADFTSPGNLAVTVQTPAPGGGTSPAASFTVTNLAPELASLPLLGITAGRPGFTLVVQGQNFTSGTVVQWNGSDRATSFRSGRRLFATIPASDVASPGQASITVRASGFLATAPQTLTIHPIPAATVTDVKSVALPANWITADPVSGRVFATVPGGVTTYGNTVAEINPNAGSIVASVFVGSEPSVAEVSDDGQYLYVGLDGAQSVRRVTVQGLTPGLQFPISSPATEELHVMPGHPQTVAVSRRNPGSSPSNTGLVIYDDGVARGATGPGHTGSNSFGWTGDGSAIFGFNFETTEFGLRRVSVGPEGATEVWVKSGLIDGFYNRIQVAGDQIYGGDGSVVDGDLRERLGGCSMSGYVAVDRALGRAFYWSDSTIHVCELANYTLLGEFTVAGVSAPPAFDRHNLVRWGTDGLAFSDGVKIFLVRTPLASP